MHPICLSINTGRCGTTFISNSLEDTYGDLFPVHHESVMDDVSVPRRHFRSFEPAELDAMRRQPAIAALLKRIDEQSQSHPFVDPGNNLVPLIPLIVDEFPGRVRVLHLVRGPVQVAASFVNFTMYAPGSEYPDQPGGWWNNALPPIPGLSRCAHPEYADRWAEMSPFEKNLWRWAEYNLFASEFHRRLPDVPFLTMTSSYLFSRQAEALGQIAAFYGLPERTPRPAPPEGQNAANPNLRFAFPVRDEWRRYRDYPYVLDLARELGVAEDPAQLEQKLPKYGPPSRMELFRYRMGLRLSRPFWRHKIAIWTGRRAAEPPAPMPALAASPLSVASAGERPDA